MENNEVKQQRLKLGMSITQVAELLGISRSQASRIERGKTKITAEMAVLIEQKLGVSRATLRPDLFVIQGVDNARC